VYLVILEPVCFRISAEKGLVTVYSYKQKIVEQIMNDLGIPIPSTGLTENMISWGLDDPYVFTPLNGIREAISTWALEWCD